MIKVKFIFKEIGANDISPYPDELSVTSLEKAEEEIRAAIKEFNDEDVKRYGKAAQPREFVRLLNDEKPQLQHRWDKADLVSGAYTRYRCLNCKIIIKVHSFSPPRGEDCFPERVCVECNREFKSEKNRDRHWDKFHT